MLNALTIDLEDWYMGLGIAFEHWESCEERITESTNIILNVLNEFNVKATFFIVGWIADRHPDLILNIKKQDHEIASHGYAHKQVFEQSPQEFEMDLKKSIDSITKVTGEKICGYRAPCWSINKKSLWALDILKKYGLTYDSSIYPVKSRFFGLPGAGQYPYLINDNLMEFPPSTIQIMGRNIPFAGGIFLRVFPYRFICQSIKAINKKNKPVIVHIHPRELDEDFPKNRLSFRNRLFHSIKIGNTQKKYRSLLKDFKFGPIKKIILDDKSYMKSN